MLVGSARLVCCGCGDTEDEDERGKRERERGGGGEKEKRMTKRGREQGASIVKAEAK